MNNRLTLFADVILPIPIHRAFTYRIPFELNEDVKIGCRVIVPFGKNKMQTAIVLSIHENIPSTYQSKYIEALLDHEPIVNDKQLEFWNWISRYYMAPIGDVMNAALPAHLKLGSETKITIHPEYDEKLDNLNERETDIIDYLEYKEECDIKDISELLSLKTVHPIIKTLIERKVLISREEIRQRYTPKTAICYTLKSEFQIEKNLNHVIEELELKAINKKQISAILEFLNHKIEHKAFIPIQKSYLIKKGVSPSALNTIVKNGIVIAERYQIDRINLEKEKNHQFKELTPVQVDALNGIRDCMTQKDVTLLHGVTGSGKTEIYVQIIQEYLDLGHQILF